MSEIWVRFYEAALLDGADEYLASVIADHMARDAYASALDDAEYMMEDR